MQIDPALSSCENLCRYVTDPALGAPVNPDRLACTAPARFDPGTLGLASGPGLNLDGAASNTQVIVYLRPDVDDVSDDGVAQTLIYQRRALADVLPANPSVAVAGSLTSAQLLGAIARALGLVSDAVSLVAPVMGRPASVQVDAVASLMYLAGPVGIALTWS